MCATCGCGKKTAKKAAKKSTSKPLVGNQSKLDMDKNGKLNKKDFKLMSNKKKAK
jgi:hypothetical protein